MYFHAIACCAQAMNAYMVNSVNILAISLLIKLGNADIPVSWLDYSTKRVLPSFDYIGECQIILFKSWM